MALLVITQYRAAPKVVLSWGSSLQVLSSLSKVELSSCLKSCICLLVVWWISGKHFSLPQPNFVCIEASIILSLRSTWSFPGHSASLSRKEDLSSNKAPNQEKELFLSAPLHLYFSLFDLELSVRLHSSKVKILICIFHIWCYKEIVIRATNKYVLNLYISLCTCYPFMNSHIVQEPSYN